MIKRATFSIEMKHWDEKAYSEIEGLPKLAQASVSNAFHGDIEAEGVLTYVLTYLEAECPFIGYEQVIGQIGDRVGSFVLQHNGTFDYAESTAKATFSVVAGSGTGDLKGLSGTGSYVGLHGQPVVYTLDYEFV